MLTLCCLVQDSSGMSVRKCGSRGCGVTSWTGGTAWTWWCSACTWRPLRYVCLSCSKVTSSAMITTAQRSVSTLLRQVRRLYQIIHPEGLLEVLKVLCWTAMIGCVELSCSAWELASGGPPADCGGAVCSDQHVELHTAGVHPASPWVSGNSADLHREDDWWHDEVRALFILSPVLDIILTEPIRMLFSFLDSCLYWWSLEQPSSVASTMSMFLMSSLHIWAGKKMGSSASIQAYSTAALVHSWKTSPKMCWLCGATNMSSLG